MIKEKFEKMIETCTIILAKRKAYMRHLYIYTGVIGFRVMFTSYKAYANNTDGLIEVGDNLRGIFDPIIELMASLGYPTTYGMIIVGGLMVITGRKAKGLEFIKWACVGYILVQFIPVILSILDMVGTQLRGSV